MIHLLLKRHYFSEPIVTGARRNSKRVARFPNCFAFNKNEAVEFRLFRLGRMVDSTSETAVYDEVSLAPWIHATPSSCAGTVSSPALSFSPAKDARWIANRGSDAISREDKIEQRV
jgi:hypothetical protein